MMQKLRRNILWLLTAGLLGLAACSEPAAEEPVREPRFATVVLGCADSGVDVETRTAMGADGLTVVWEEKDEIRLWASPSGSGAFLDGVEALPFYFSFFGPARSHAGFSGNVDLAAFDEAQLYDYRAVWAPAGASAEGTVYACTIPAEQDGSFDTQYDILTAGLTGAPALRAGDDNPAVRLRFEHHVHLLDFEIPRLDWAEGEQVRAVELTFPGPVAGTLRVDAAGVQPDAFEGSTDRLMIKFPRGGEKVSGDRFCAVVAPVNLAGQPIRMRIYGYAGYVDVETQPLDRDFAANHATPVKLNVGPMTAFYKTFTLQFKVVDNDRPETQSLANGLGKNTLGEAVQSIRIKEDETNGTAGIFDKAIQLFGCTIQDGVLQAAVSQEQLCSVLFVDSSNPDYPWPDELFDPALYIGQNFQVEYESERALIQSENNRDYLMLQIPEAELSDGVREITLSVPYLFEEDFSQSSGTSRISSNSAYAMDEYSPYTKGWSASRFDVSSNVAFRMSAYFASGSQTNPDRGDNHRGRLTTDYLPLKTETPILVSYRVTTERSYYSVSRKYVYATYELGLDTDSGNLTGDNQDLAYTAFSESSYDNDDLPYDGDYTTQLQQRDITIPGCTNAHRVSWRSSFVAVDNSIWTIAQTVYVYLDDIKIKLAD